MGVCKRACKSYGYLVSAHTHGSGSEYVTHRVGVKRVAYTVKGIFSVKYELERLGILVVNYLTVGKSEAVRHKSHAAKVDFGLCLDFKAYGSNLARERVIILMGLVDFINESYGISTDRGGSCDSLTCRILINDSSVNECGKSLSAVTYELKYFLNTVCVEYVIHRTELAALEIGSEREIVKIDDGGSNGKRQVKLFELGLHTVFVVVLIVAVRL